MSQEYSLVRTASGTHGPATRVLYPDSEAESASNPVALWRILYKRRWTVVLTFVALVATVVAATLVQTPIYRARALLEFQKEDDGMPSLRDVFELGHISNTYMETQYRLLRSDSLARRVIEALDLESAEEFQSRRWWGGSAPPETEPTLSASTGGIALPSLSKTEEKVLRGFQERLHVDPVLNSRLVHVSFDSWDPKLSAAAVSSLVANYIELSRESGRAATKWLSEELERVKLALEASEGELHDYARENGLLFLEEGGSASLNMSNQRLLRLQEELTRAQAARLQKEALYRLALTGDVSALPGVLDNELMQELTLRLSELRREEAQLSAVFDRQYPRLRQIRTQVEKLEAMLEEERQRAAKSIINDYHTGVRHERLVRQAFQEEQRRADTTAGHASRYSILKREVDTQRQLYDSLLLRLREAGVSAGLEAASVRVVDAARPPLKPTSPSLMFNFALALVAGLGCGVGAACFQEYFDRSVETPVDVERWFQVPSLGLIPAAEHDGALGRGYDRVRRLTGRTEKDAQPLSGSPVVEATRLSARWHRIDECEDGRPLLAEAFRNLRTSVLMSSSNSSPLRSLLVTSSEPGEGKTTVATNLAIAVAQMGKKVLLVDSDLRRPSLHKAFETPGGKGLSDHLSRRTGWRKLPRSTSVPGLDLIVAGRRSKRGPAELLSDAALGELIREATEAYDLVILDSPPLLGVADARILAAAVDGVMMVVKGNATPRDLVYRAAVGTLDVGAKIIGIVLNQMKPMPHSYYYQTPY